MVAEAREGRMLRRGLPRVSGGEPWPPADARGPVAEDAPTAPPEEVAPLSAGAPAAPLTPTPVPTSGISETTGGDAAPSSGGAGDAPTSPTSPAVASGIDPEVAADPARTSAAPGLRRGLPRVAGGEPWPPASTAASVPSPPVIASASSSGSDASAQPPTALSTAPSPAEEAVAQGASVEDARSRRGTPAEAISPGASATEGGASDVRRGLPRTAGGEAWPPAGTVPLLAPAAQAATDAVSPAPVAAPVAQTFDGATETATSTTVTPTTPTTAVAATTSAPAATTVSVLGPDLATPLPGPRTVWNGRAPRRLPASPAPVSARPRPSWTQAVAVLFGAAALGVLAAAAVALVRTLLSLPAMQDFLAAYPGEYEPTVAVEPGFAPWIGWQHFFNVFLMVLIIRSGLRIRTEKRPTAFWAPRNNPKGKTSLTIWFHQALDVLWLVNGVIFVVLLFTTGHWVRIVPTSWEVLPNALSAALQYVSFDWPHENGWNNYNSLQQIAYFATVFIAAPLAAITGFRMSGMWPKKAEKLSRAYPVEWARKLHFPIMLYFVAFIIVHVALVMLTGFLRNLNHMYAAQDAATWTGFWVFIASLVVIAIGWVAARPLVIAPIAKVFGTVSAR